MMIEVDLAASSWR